MADDIKIKLGLDATELFAGISKATAEINKLSTAKVDIQEGPIVADLNKIETEAKQTGAAIDKELGGGIEGAKGKLGGLGDLFSGTSGSALDLGGSFQSLTSGVTGLVPGLGSLSGILAGGGITAGIAAVGAGVAYAVDKGKEFETQLASLSSITGVSGDGLADLGDKAKVMAAKFGTDATANIESFKTILSKLGPDIAKSPEALNSMAESVNTLSKATGDDPGKATEALTGALLQFGVSLDDPKKAADAMAVAMNVLAAGAKEGASEVPDVAAAINVAGVAASSAKVSFEETNSAIQVLAAGGKVGAEAGTSLRNVLNKLGEGRFLPKDTATELKAAGVDIAKLGDTSISFSERLRELNKISGDAALKTKLFGTDAAAASILIKGANGSMDDLTKKLTGTNTAYDQAAINMATFDESLNRIKSNVDNFAISFYDGMKMSFGMLAESIGPSVTELMTSIGGYFSRMWSVVQPILAALGALIMGTISNALTFASETLNLFFETAVYAFDQVIAAVQPLVDAIKSALGIDGAMGQGIDVVKLLQEAMNFMSDAISAIFDVLQSFAKILIDVVVFAFKGVIGAITTVIETLVYIGKAIGNFISGIPGVETAINGLKGAFESVYNFFAGLPNIIAESQAYLKAIGGTFQTVFNIIGEAFNAAINLDFGGAAAKLASVFESQTWVSAFSSNLEKARAEVKKTAESTKEAGKEFKTFLSDSGAATTAPKGAAEKEKKDKEKTALEILKASYKDQEEALQAAIERELVAEKNKYADKKVLREKLEAEANTQLKAFLNNSLAGINDANVYLEKNQLTVKIQPSKAKGETVNDIDSFYTKEFAKLNKEAKIKIDTGIRAKPEDFKEVLKEYSDLAKEVSKTSESLIPVTFAADEESLNATIVKVQQYIDFIKSQNDEIAAKQAEAIASGNQEAADKFGESIQSNIQNINLLSSRLERFKNDSKKAIENSTGWQGAIMAIQTAMLDVFNAEKLKKEKETNDKIRDEKLAALATEEKDLQNALAKREISFEEYSQKVGQIEQNRRDAQTASEKTFMERMKEVTDKSAGAILKQQSKDIGKFVEDQFKGTSKNAEAAGKALGKAMANMANSFADLALSGKATLADFARSSVMVAYQALQEMIPIFIAEIAGKQFSELGLAGIAAAAGLTILLNGLFAAAAPSLGFKDGVVELQGSGTETSDSIPAWLSRGESVITAAGTRANREELAWMNANPGMSIKDYFVSQVPTVRYSVNQDGDLIHEVRKLREETRGLGKSISKNTYVEVSGSLIADNKSIKAVIDADKRRNARRG